MVLMSMRGGGLVGDGDAAQTVDVSAGVEGEHAVAAVDVPQAQIAAGRRGQVLVLAQGDHGHDEVLVAFELLHGDALAHLPYPDLGVL